MTLIQAPWADTDERSARRVGFDIAWQLATASEWLADHLATIPDVMTSRFTGRLLTLYPDGPAEFAACARWLAQGSNPDSPVTKEHGEVFMSVVRHFGEFTIAATEYRDRLCERVKVGTEWVQVPDPDAAPTPTVTVERDVYEWQCNPILASVDSEVGF